MPSDEAIYDVERFMNRQAERSPEHCRAQCLPISSRLTPAFRPLQTPFADHIERESMQLRDFINHSSGAGFHCFYGILRGP